MKMTDKRLKQLESRKDKRLKECIVIFRSEDGRYYFEDFEYSEAEPMTDEQYNALYTQYKLVVIIQTVNWEEC